MSGWRYLLVCQAVDGAVVAGPAPVLGQFWEGGRGHREARRVDNVPVEGVQLGCVPNEVIRAILKPHSEVIRAMTLDYSRCCVHSVEHREELGGRDEVPAAVDHVASPAEPRAVLNAQRHEVQHVALRIPTGWISVALLKVVTPPGLRSGPLTDIMQTPPWSCSSARLEGHAEMGAPPGVDHATEARREPQNAPASAANAP